MELTINGQRVTAEPNETLLKCATRHGIDIPHLCTIRACRPWRLPDVHGRDRGYAGFPTACTTPVSEGMACAHRYEALRELCRNILALMMLEHPSACLICERRELCDDFRPKSEKVGRTTGCHTCNNKQVCEVRKPRRNWASANCRCRRFIITARSNALNLS